MPEVTGVGESKLLVEGQQWKLWLAGALLAIAGAGFLMPDGIGRVLGVPGVAVELGAMAFCFGSLTWAAYAVRTSGNAIKALSSQSGNTANKAAKNCGPYSRA